MKRGNVSGSRGRARRTPGFSAGLHSATAIAISLTLLAVDAGVAAPAQAQAKATATEAKDLPALVSAPAPRKAVESPGGDFSNPPLLSPDDPRPTPTPKAPSFDKGRSTPVDAETTSTRKVFANPDGTRTAELATHPVRFKDPAGAWADIDLALAVGPDGTSAPKAASVSVRFGARADGPVATLVTPAGAVALRHPGAAAVAPVTDKDHATYAKALAGGRDLVLAATAEGFKESVILPGASAPASYSEELVLPAGLGARQGPGGVELVDAAGAVVATYANGTAHDAAFPANGPDGLTPVVVTLADAKAEASVATVAVSIDPAWLAGAGRAFPVTVDPSLVNTTAAAQSGQDTWVQNGANANVVLGASPYLFAGTSDGGVTLNRTLLSFDLGTTPATDVVVTSAKVTIWNYYSTICNPAPVMLQGAGAAWSQATTTWANQPVADINSPKTNGPAASKGATGCAAGYDDYDVTGQAQRWMNLASPNYGLLLTTSESLSSAIRGWYPAEAGYSVALTVTYDHLPTTAAQLEPAANATIATATPLLTVSPGTDSDGDVVHYWYTVSTSPDASVGQRVVWSGWLGGAFPYENPNGATNGTTYRVPAGALQDGVTYYWGVSTWDGVAPNTSRPPGTLRSFTVDLGQGARGGRPTDTLGPATVDLASGNLSVGHASPALPTVGGSIGMSYTYNSVGAAAAPTEPAPGRTSGLRGVYYNTTAPDYSFNGKTPVLSRRDSNLAFLWSADHASPAPGVVQPDDFLVRWSGSITVPVTGTWNLWTANDGGVKITVAGTTVLNDWVDHYVWPNYSSNMTLLAGVAVPIVVEYFEHDGAALLALGAKGPMGTGGAVKEVIVPTSWLSTDATPLPAGWSLGAGTLAHDALRLGEDAAVITDPSGRSRVWASTGPGGGFTPPPDSDTTLALDAAGAATLHGEDGLAYVFDVAGQLAGATSALDDAAQAATNYTWSDYLNYPKRLLKLTDPVSLRDVKLHYGRLNEAPPTALTPAEPACPTPPAGFAPAPAYNLCQVQYWDGTETLLWYNASGQLARMVDPGGAVTDFSYNPAGLLSAMRDPLVADAVAATATTKVPDDDTARTLVTYDATTKRATHLTLPVPYDGTTPTVRPRPGRGYEYVPTTETRVHVDGLSGATDEPNGYNRKVIYDAAGRMTTSLDATAKLTSFTWDAARRPTSVTDAAGRESTTVYDGDATRAQSTGRLSDTYGPAPATCFPSGAVPGACAVPPPHTHTDYDTMSATAATGLAMVAWANAGYGGAPKLRAEAPVTAGAVVTATPTGLPSASWSARYTGEVTLGSTGTYGFALAATGGRGKLFVDDVAVADSAVGAGAGSRANTAVGRHRIRVDFAASSATPTLNLSWTPPGGSSQAVAATNLAPRFANPTKTTTDDDSGVPARITTAVYDSMPQGVVKEEIVDPGTAPHLNLVTTTAYETGGLRRPVSRTLPAGDTANANTATTYAYYANTEGAPAVCGQAAGVNQAGRLHTTTSPSPDATSAGRRVNEVVFDATGRPKASRVNTEGWSCKTYDGRGGLTQSTTPAFGGESGHIVDYNYTVGANPMVASITEGTSVITTRVDLLGRVISYSDTWAKTTTSTYDQAGRLISSAGPAGLREATYDPAGRIKTQSFDGALMATPAYNSAGELASVSYAAPLSGGNGTSLSAIARHPSGMTTALTWAGLGTLATDVVARSQSGKVVDESIDGTDAYPGALNYNFIYDPAGRLTQARVPGQVLDYGFATSGGCGTQLAPGRNANRSSLTLNGTATTYCYNQADRLSSSTDAAVGTPAYDSHGNTTDLGTQHLIYDGTDQHMETKVSGTTVVRYQRDPTGRITSRKEGTAAEVHYGFTGPGDSPSFVMDASNAVPALERSIGLVGGAMVTKRGGLLGAGDVWSYPNVHGDVMAVADNAGAKQGATKTYDPNGVALAGLPDNSAGNLDYGWLGQNQRPIEHAGALATIEMGARQYVPSIGRFLEVDPVTGGSCNDYDYVCGDPGNGSDLSGLRGTKPLPDRDAECLGGNYDQLTSAGCTAYRQAKVTGDSDFYYKGKTLPASRGRGTIDASISGCFGVCVSGGVTFEAGHLPSPHVGAGGGPDFGVQGAVTAGTGHINRGLNATEQCSAGFGTIGASQNTGTNNRSYSSGVTSGTQFGCNNGLQYNF
jgi:RHS repeat-associated protein